MEAPAIPLRVAIYRRISQDDEDDAKGVARQDQDCRELAGRNKWVVVANYCDNDISASTNSNKPRPEYDLMLEAARRREFDAVLSDRSNRVTRRPRELEDLIDLAEVHGTRFHYVKSPDFDLNTAAGRMVARVLAAADANEAEQTSERTKRKLKERRDAGLTNNLFPRYGYQVVDGKYVVVEELREHLADAYRRWGNGEVSFRTLAIEWNTAGRYTYRGNAWSEASVRNMMDTASAAALIREHSTPNTSMTLESFDVWRPGQWEPIINLDTWTKYMARRLVNNRTPPAAVASDRDMSGVLVCGLCRTDQEPVRMRATKFRDKQAWRCPRWKDRKAHAHLGVLDEDVQAAVLNWIEEHVTGGDDVDARADRIARGRQAQADVVSLQAELDQLKAKRREIGRQSLAGIIDEEDAVAFRAETEAHMARVSGLIEKAERVAEHAELDQIAAFTTLREEWPTFTPVERREALKAVLKCVVVHPARRKGAKPILRLHAA